jgi:hypothetical protein
VALQVLVASVQIVGSQVRKWSLLWLIDTASCLLLSYES